jgi:hypothetical protein
MGMIDDCQVASYSFLTSTGWISDATEGSGSVRIVRMTIIPNIIANIIIIIFTII